MQKDSLESPRFTVSILEWLSVVAILSTLFAIVLPAIEAGRYANQLPPMLPILHALHEDNPPWLFLIGTPITVTASVAMLFGVVRLFLPKTIRRYFVWKKPSKIQPVSTQN